MDARTAFGHSREWRSQTLINRRLSVSARLGQIPAIVRSDRRCPTKDLHQGGIPRIRASFATLGISRPHLDSRPRAVQTLRRSIPCRNPPRASRPSLSQRDASDMPSASGNGGRATIRSRGLKWRREYRCHAPGRALHRASDVRQHRTRTRFHRTEDCHRVAGELQSQLRVCGPLPSRQVFWEHQNACQLQCPAGCSAGGLSNARNMLAPLACLRKG